MTYKVYEDTPKRGETYGGWFAYTVRPNGHIAEIQGGFASHTEATTWAKEASKHAR